MFASIENAHRIELRLNEGETTRGIVLGTFDDIHIARNVCDLINEHMKWNEALIYLIEVHSETQEEL